MTRTEKTRTFLGMRIVGDYNQGSLRKDQRPAGELGKLVRTVFADGVIDAVRWDQATPYFNDGDPCVFSADGGSLRVRLVDRTLNEHEAQDAEDSADYRTSAEDFALGWVETDTYGARDPFALLVGRRTYDRGYSARIEGPHVELAKAVYALKDAIGGGEFDDALLELFGDHATITVPASGDIEVQEYSHD